MTFSLIDVLKRFYWDMSDPQVKRTYYWWLIWQIPGPFGDMLRSWYACRVFKYVGKNVKILAGTRFRSPEKIWIGDNSIIGNDNFIQALGGIKIGSNVLTGPGCKIWTANHVYISKNIPISDQGLELKSVVIGNDVWLAGNVFIMPGVELPEGVVVSAGSVVSVKQYKPYSILAGNPARMIGMRKE